VALLLLRQQLKKKCSHSSHFLVLLSANILISYIYNTECFSTLYHLHNFRFRKKLYLTPPWNWRLRYGVITHYSKIRGYYTAVYCIITTLLPVFVKIDQLLKMWNETSQAMYG